MRDLAHPTRFAMYARYANNPSGIREAFDPFQAAKHVGMAAEIAFARGDTEDVAGALVSDGAPDALGEQRKLLL